MKYTEEDIINQAKALKEACQEREYECETCPFNYGCNIKCPLYEPCYWNLNGPNEQKPKYIPFDFSLKEDRDAVRDKWIKDVRNGHELKVDSFRDGNGIDPFGEGCIWSACGYKPEFLFECFVFLDTGLPVGKEVEE